MQIWTPNQGFMLNGYKVPVKGVSNHQDFGGTGVAVPDRINMFRVAGLRAIGINAVSGYVYAVTGVAD